MTQEERDIRRKIKVLEHACSSGNVSKTCRYFGISRETYYCWRRRYQQYGEKGLVNRRPGPGTRLGVRPRRSRKKSFTCDVLITSELSALLGSYNGIGWRSPRAVYVAPSPGMDSKGCRVPSTNARSWPNRS